MEERTTPRISRSDKVELRGTHRLPSAEKINWALQYRLPSNNSLPFRNHNIPLKILLPVKSKVNQETLYGKRKSQKIKDSNTVEPSLHAGKERKILTKERYPCYNRRYGEMSEWFKEPVLKTGDSERDRGFESHSLRHGVVLKWLKRTVC